MPVVYHHRKDGVTKTNQEHRFRLKRMKALTLIKTGTLALIGTALLLPTNARADHDSHGGASLGRDIRALDLVTDRLHAQAARELPRRGPRSRILDMIRDFERSADQIRFGYENGLPTRVLRAKVNRSEELACATATSVRRARVSPGLHDLLGDAVRHLKRIDASLTGGFEGPTRNAGYTARYDTGRAGRADGGGGYANEGRARRR